MNKKYKNFLKTKEWLDEGRYAESAGQHVYKCTHCCEHIVEYPSELGSFCKYCGSDN